MSLLHYGLRDRAGSVEAQVWHSPRVDRLFRRLVYAPKEISTCTKLLSQAPCISHSLYVIHLNCQLVKIIVVNEYIKSVGQGKKSR